jgi:hypothetical protein
MVMALAIGSQTIALWLSPVLKFYMSLCTGKGAIVTAKFGFGKFLGIIISPEAV